MTVLPPGFGDPTQSAGGVAPDSGLIQQLMAQPFVGYDLGQLLAQQGFTNQEAQQQFGLTNQQLGVESGGVNRQLAALPKEQALANQLLGLQGQQLGISREQLGLQGKSLDITQQQEQQAADVARRSAWSGATARGATNTSGFRQGLGDISNQLADQLAQLGLSRQGLGLQGQGLDIQGQRLGVEQQQSDINYGLQFGSLQDQLAQLGISGEAAQIALQNAQQGAGINAVTGGINVLQNAAANNISGAVAVPGQVAGAPAPPQNTSPQQGSFKVPNFTF